MVANKDLKKKRLEANIKLHLYLLHNSRLNERLKSEVESLGIVVNTMGHIIGVNSVWEDVMGYSSEETIGLQYDSFMDGHYVATTRDAFSTLKHMDSPDEKFINRYITKYGENILLEWYGWERDGELIVSFARVL